MLIEPFVDAHQHFWDIESNSYPWLKDHLLVNFRYGDYSSLCRNYLPSDFEQDCAADVPVLTVHIEAEWERNDPVAETKWLTDLARQTGRPSALVAHANLLRSDVNEILAAQSAFSMVRGIRHKPVTSVTASEARRGLPGSMDDDQWREGYALLSKHHLSFDLQAPYWNLDQAADLVDDFPDTALILNHTGLPCDRSIDGLKKWRSSLERLARAPNTFIKISGLGQAGLAWSAVENVPIIRDAISIFGVDRCMFASNFPVDGLVTNYPCVIAAYKQAISHRPSLERAKLLHDNAVRIYRL